jgi:hypothetical protein
VYIVHGLLVTITTQEVNVVLMQLNQMEIPGKNRGLERKSKSMKRNVEY